MAKVETSNETLKKILSEQSEPVLFKDVLCTTEGSNCWKFLDWSLDDLADKFGDLKLPFRTGKNSRTVQPQWEIDTPLEYKTMKEFLNDITCKRDPSKWFYFDYKHMKEWFKEKPEILTSINWQQFELELDGSDSTIWIGSKGAHTNCHQDTYGCNLVAQTHGRKLWLLFSPDCNNFMQSTRIPYEESTIYSKYNFFAPSIKEIEAIKNMPSSVKMVILEPKDVLFIPKRWWHYVESLETSLSVNVWLPVKKDCYARLEETLVNLVVTTIGDGIPKAVDQPESNLTECIRFVETSLRECQKSEENAEPLQKKRKLDSGDTISLESLSIKYPNHVELLPSLTSDNINDFVKKNNIVNDNSTEKKNINENNDELSHLSVFEAVVDAFCHPSVTLKVSQILREKFFKKC